MKLAGILVVLCVVIGAMVGIVFLSNAVHGRSDTPVVRTLCRMENVQCALNEFLCIRGAYPESLSALSNDPNTNDWADFLHGCPPPFVDSWSNGLRYVRHGTNVFTLASAGSDCMFGTDDDIFAQSENNGDANKTNGH